MTRGGGEWVLQAVVGCSTGGQGGVVGYLPTIFTMSKLAGPLIFLTAQFVI